jgi:elongation factor Ts
MSITAGQVKELRELTGVGLMDCKKALVETNGSVEDAVKFLREKGLSKAAKKADRSTTEGKVFIQNNGSQVVIVEINCETDFVANNDDFAALGKSLTSHVLNNKISDISALESSSVEGKSFADFVSGYVMKLGENIQVKQFNVFESATNVSSYTHMNGKIGVVVSFTGEVNEDTGRDVAMHVAAVNPQYVKSEDVPPGDLDNEREILRNQMINEGKPAEIVDKIVNGKISKFYKENCLLEQAFVKDDKQSVKQVLGNVSVDNFVRYQLG